MAAAKKRIDLQELDLSQDDPSKPAHLQDMVVSLLRLRGITVAIIFGYLTDGVGIAGVNIRKLEQLRAFVRALSIPWIFLADMNVKPEEMISSGWPEILGAEARLPADAAGLGWTCRNNAEAGGTFIDFGLFSTSAIPLARQFFIYHFVPWGPHFGLCLHLEAAPLQIRVWQPIKPKRIMVPTQQTLQLKGIKRRQRERQSKPITAGQEQDDFNNFVEDGGMDADVHADATATQHPDYIVKHVKMVVPNHMWRDSSKLANVYVELADAKTCLGPWEAGPNISQLLDPTAAAEVTRQHQLWAAQAEISLIQLAQIPDDKASLYGGRAAQSTSFRLTCPYSDRSAEQSCGLFKHRQANQWAQLTMRLKDAVAVCNKQVVHYTAAVRNVKECLTKMVKLKPEKVGKSGLDTKEFITHIQLQMDDEHLHPAILAGLHSKAQAVAKAFRHKAVWQCSLDFKDWVKAAVEKGAGAAHKHSRKPQQPEPLKEFIMAGDAFAEGPQKAAELRADKWDARWQRDLCCWGDTIEALKALRGCPA